MTCPRFRIAVGAWVLLVVSLLAIPAQAAPPAFQAAGTAQNGTGSVNPAWPAHAIDDIALLFVESTGGEAATLSTPAGFAAVTNSPQATGTTTNGTRITVFWARATSTSMATPTVLDPGDHVYARILTYRGVIKTGNPWDATGGNVKASASTSVTVTGVDTTVADTLIVQAVARDNDSAAAAFSAQTNTNLASITEQSDAGTTSGNGGGFAVWDGVKATAGATGDTTATVTSSINAFLTIALKPALPAPSLASPADNATVLTSTPTFDWTDVTDPNGGTVTYDIQADNSGCTFASPELNQTGVASSFHTAGSSLADGTYCWRVRAVDQNGSPGAWSTTRNVIVDGITITSQTRSPSAAADCTSLGGAGDNWSTTGNAASANNAYATASVDGTVTDPLQCLNYAFAIPTNATILGIVVNVERKSDRTQNNGSRDNSLFLVKGGAAVGANRATATTYTTSDVVEAHGSAVDLWGTTWTPSEINATNFGSVFTATKPDSNGQPHVISVDHIQITVHYSFSNFVPPNSFNVVESGANATTGRIYTKIAGQDIAVDIVALDASNAVSTSFTGPVVVELVDASGAGACSSLSTIKALANQTFVGGDNGRHPLSSGQFEANAYRNVKFRVKYPTTSPTVTACSGDAFANRPASFASVQARDQNRTTAGTTNALTNTADPGAGTVHNAGMPFRVDATAVNGAGSPATTDLYSPDSGQPVAVLSRCGGGTPPAACLPAASLGAVTFGSWSALNGAINSTTASYNKIGSFNLELEDRTFSSVDDADKTATSVRYIRSSAPLTVGRFVPDHFAITAASVTHRTDFSGCTDTFTYLGERMNVVFTLEARDSGGSALAAYDAGSLAAFNLSTGAYNFAAIDTAAPTPFSVTPSTPTGSPAWAGGAATVTAPIVINRPAAAAGPYTAMKIGIVPSDADGVTMQTLDLDADNSGSSERAKMPLASDPELRFGRLRLENAVGSEKLDLPIPIQTQYWTGTTFARNLGDSCTQLSAVNIQLGNYLVPGGIDSGNMNSANISLGGTFSSGFGSLTLTKPLDASSNPPSSAGAVTLTVDLAAEAKSYLKGNWGVSTYTADPSSRAAFGLYGSQGQPNNFIYFRENY